MDCPFLLKHKKNEMENKFCVLCNTEKVLIISTTNDPENKTNVYHIDDCFKN